MLSESVLEQNGPNDHFGQNALIPTWILAFAGPHWTKTVHFGPFRSANRTLAIPDKNIEKSFRSIRSIYPSRSVFFERAALCVMQIPKGSTAF